MTRPTSSHAATTTPLPTPSPGAQASPGAFDSLRARHTLGWRSVLLILLYGGTLLSINLGGSRALTYHEVIFAQPGREMLATGEWLLPRHGGVPSTHKPPGTHATLAVMMWLTGSESEGYLRIPAVLCGLAVALLVGMVGARWFDRQTGLLAALMQLTVYYVLQLARLAEGDMPLVAMVTAAMSVFALANVESPLGRVSGRYWSWLFYLLAAASYQVKGGIGPLFLFASCGSYALLTRHRHVWRFLLNPLGIVLFLCGTAGWLYAAQLQYPRLLDDQLMHHVGRFHGELGGRKPLLYYIYSLALITLPWMPWIVAGSAVGLWRGGWRQPFGKLVLCWVVPGLVALLGSAFQSKHYPAPLMPPLSIVGAVALAAYLRWWEQRRGAWHWTAAGLSLIGAGIATGIIWQTEPRAAETIVALIGLMTLGALGLIYFCSRRHSAAAQATLFTTVWLVIAGVFCYIMPQHDSYRDQKLLAQRTNLAVPPDEPIHLVRLEENQIFFYLQPRIVRTDDPARFAEALRNADSDESAALPTYALMPQHVAEQLAQQYTVETLDRCASISSYLTEAQRITLVRIDSPLPPLAGQSTSRR